MSFPGEYGENDESPSHNPTPVDAIHLIRCEQNRARAKGYTIQHDDSHEDGVIGRAGICYAEAGISVLEGVSIDDPPAFWPWENAPHLFGQPYIELLVKGAAMIASEIDKQLRDMGKVK